jgi:hypothetical protein
MVMVTEVFATAICAYFSIVVSLTCTFSGRVLRLKSTVERVSMVILYLLLHLLLLNNEILYKNATQVKFHSSNAVGSKRNCFLQLLIRVQNMPVDMTNIKSYLEGLDSYADIRDRGMVTSDKWFYVLNNICLRKKLNVIVSRNICSKKDWMNYVYRLRDRFI